MRETILNLEDHHLDTQFALIWLQPHPWPDPNKYK